MQVFQKWIESRKYFAGSWSTVYRASARSQET